MMEHIPVRLTTENELLNNLPQSLILKGLRRGKAFKRARQRRAREAEHKGWSSYLF